MSDGIIMFAGVVSFLIVVISTYVFIIAIKEHNKIKYVNVSTKKLLERLCYVYDFLAKKSNLDFTRKIDEMKNQLNGKISLKKQHKLFEDFYKFLFIENLKETDIKIIMAHEFEEFKVINYQIADILLNLIEVDDSMTVRSYLNGMKSHVNKLDSMVRRRSL